MPDQDEDKSLQEWWNKIKGSPNPLVTLKAFALGVHAAALHEAADAVAETESEESDEFAGLLRSRAEAADADYRRYCGG